MSSTTSSPSPATPDGSSGSPSPSTRQPVGRALPRPVPAQPAPPPAPVRIGLAVVAALAFDVWHAIREGPWAGLTPALVFGTLVAVGVLAIYLGTVVPLRLLRPPAPRTT